MSDPVSTAATVVAIAVAALTIVAVAASMVCLLEWVPCGRKTGRYRSRCTGENRSAVTGTSSRRRL